MPPAHLVDTEHVAGSTARYPLGLTARALVSARCKTRLGPIKSTTRGAQVRSGGHSIPSVLVGERRRSFSLRVETALQAALVSVRRIGLH